MSGKYVVLLTLAANLPRRAAGGSHDGLPVVCVLVDVCWLMNGKIDAKITLGLCTKTQSTTVCVGCINTCT